MIFNLINLNINILNFNTVSISCDAPERYQVFIQDPATESMEWLLNLHDSIMVNLVMVVAVIFFLVNNIIKQSNSNFYVFGDFRRNLSKQSESYFSHCQSLEIFWTIIPALILLSIASPTFDLLYALDDLVDPALVLKIIGHQWYWSYEYTFISLLGDFVTHNFSSYIVNTNDLTLGSLRLLETDTRIKLPSNVHIRLLITSADVLHSWTIPSFGLKVDACPGRLCQASLFIKREGLFFGQCSEICGVNHGFMPIVVRAVNPTSFLNNSFPEIY